MYSGRAFGLADDGHQTQARNVQPDLDHVGRVAKVDDVARRLGGEEFALQRRYLAAAHATRDLVEVVDEAAELNPFERLSCQRDAGAVTDRVQVFADLRLDERRGAPEFPQAVEVDHQRPIGIDEFVQIAASGLGQDGCLQERRERPHLRGHVGGHGGREDAGKVRPADPVPSRAKNDSPATRPCGGNSADSRP